MDIVFYTACCQLVAECVGRRLAGVLRNDHAVDRNAHRGNIINQTQNFHVIADAEICADFGFFNIARRNGENNFCLLAHFVKQTNLAVGVKARKHARCVVVVKQFSAKLQIELTAPLRNALLNVLCLLFNIQVVVESQLNHKPSCRLSQFIT